MKDLIKDRLIHLATAQEHMKEAADHMIHWDKSQLIMEKSAFDSLNLSDEVLNLSKSGNILVGRLLECCQALIKSPGAAEQKKMLAVLEELMEIFQRIEEVSAHMNEISHRIETEAAAQRGMEENIKALLSGVAENVDTAAACTEFIMSDFNM